MTAKTFGHRGRAVALLVLTAIAISGCSRGREAADQGPEPTASTPAAGSPTATPTTTPDTTAGPMASPGTASPGATASPTPLTPASCTTVLPRRIGKITSQPARTTEVVTVVSDGRTLTPGSSEQTDFVPPALTGPDGTRIEDPNTITVVAELIADASRNRVLTARPPAPDEGADPARRPFDTPGTYALYNASGPLAAEVTVLCSGQEQRWDFAAETNPVSGVVNCAVEPARSNALARLVYQTKC